MAKLTKPKTTGLLHRDTVLATLLDNLLSKRRVTFEGVVPSEDTKIEIEVPATGDLDSSWASLVSLSTPTLCTAWITKVSDTRLEVHVFHTAQAEIDIDVDVYILGKHIVSA